MLLIPGDPNSVRSLWDEGCITWAEYESTIFKEATPRSFSEWVSSAPEVIGCSVVDRVRRLASLAPEDLITVQGGCYYHPPEGASFSQKTEMVNRAKSLLVGAGITL